MNITLKICLIAELVLLASAMLILSGCEVQKEVTFDQLTANPGSYNGRTITVDGFFFEGFEVEVLAEKLEPSGLAPGHIWPKGKMIWIEGGIPQEARDRLTQQNQVGPRELFGRIRITGKFSYGSKYGHLDGYDSQIKPERVEILN
jgi:hypothetical protein